MCWAGNPMHRPALDDMKHMLYLPASVFDLRNEAHGYITDDNYFHGICEDNAYVHLSLLMTSLNSKIQTHNFRIAAFGLTPETEDGCLLIEDEADSDSSEDEVVYFMNEDEDDFAMQTV